MSQNTLETEVAAYLQSPVSGEKLPSTFSLGLPLSALLPQLASERGVPVDALVEFLLFRQIRAEQARRMVGEPLEPLPASFLREDVARAKLEVAKDLAAVKALQEQGGDKAQRLTGELQAMLDDVSGTDAELEAVRRQSAVDEARIDMALEKEGRK